MIYKEIEVSMPGSIGTPTLTTYLISDTESLRIRQRPMVIVCPGGAYCCVSDREGEMIALQFCAMGYHAAILRYSVCPAEYPAALLELAKSVAVIRQNASKWHVNTSQIYIQGSSAGGHLAASYGCFWKKDFLKEAVGCGSEELRPNGIILSYPVISSGEFAHRDSIKNLLGSKYEELVEEMSLENQVTEDMPRTFLWHTVEDGLVPVENSLLLMQALRRKNIPFEAHIYPKGGHGLSLANELTRSPDGNEVQGEVASWMSLLKTFLEAEVTYD